MDDEYLVLSGRQLAKLIASGKASSVDIVNAHIAQIERVNPTINALVAERFDLAREEAVGADAQIRNRDREELGAFHGVPFTVKECFSLQGMPNSAGLVARRDLIAAEDATVVARIRKTGGIPLGVTNTSELCMWMETNNRVYGRTNNPYDQSRIVGGSSGGEGAVIGAGGSPFGVGSDIGGSIRLPAFCNGVFGHKPTGRLVPGTGQYPIAENEALAYLTTGPLSRRAEDLWPLLKAMSGEDGHDSAVRTFDLGDPNGLRVEDLRVMTVEDNGKTPVAPELRDIQRRAANRLAELGATVVEAKVPALEHSYEVWSQMLSAADGTPFRTLLADMGEMKMGSAFISWALGKSPHTLPALILALVEHHPLFVPDDKSVMLKVGLELRQELLNQIGGYGVMLFPSYSRVAPRHYLPLTRPFDWVYTAVFNVLELPVTQVPMGLNEEGAPLGIQVVTSHGNDHLSIAVALELEREFGGWVPPWESANGR